MFLLVGKGWCPWLLTISFSTGKWKHWEMDASSSKTQQTKKRARDKIRRSPTSGSSFPAQSRRSRWRAGPGCTPSPPLEFAATNSPHPPPIQASEPRVLRKFGEKSWQPREAVQEERGFARQRFPEVWIVSMLRGTRNRLRG